MGSHETVCSQWKDRIWHRGDGPAVLLEVVYCASNGLLLFLLRVYCENTHSLDMLASNNSFRPANVLFVERVDMPRSTVAYIKLKVSTVKNA